MTRARDDHSQPDLNQSDRDLNASSTPDRNESGRSATGRTAGAGEANERSSSGKNARNSDSAREAAQAGGQQVASPSERNRSQTNTGLGGEQETGGLSGNEQLSRGRSEAERQGRGPEDTGGHDGMAKNDSVDAAVELSERGGIRPEETDATRHHDRSRDRGSAG